MSDLPNGAEDVSKVFWQGVVYAYSSNWLRMTQNPQASDYPSVGDVIEVKGHPLLDDARYLVIEVMEFEPPVRHRADDNGRDIRISLIGPHHESHHDLNGRRIVQTIVAIDRAEHVHET